VSTPAELLRSPEYGYSESGGRVYTNVHVSHEHVNSGGGGITSSGHSLRWDWSWLQTKSHESRAWIAALVRLPSMTEYLTPFVLAVLAALAPQYDFRAQAASPKVTPATHAVTPASAAPPARLSEKGYVRIGGIDQWITVKGEDRRNPVVLFLHGGPGFAWSPFADSTFGAWEKKFTLVQWDERGAGRTYGKTGPSIEPTMTLDRMVSDGLEVADYLTRHLRKKKIILFGASWGSILGIHMVKRRPELFDAYIGEAQVVNIRASEAASYARVLEIARSNGDQQAVKDLESLGPPPWNSIGTWSAFHKIVAVYQAKSATAAPAPFKLSPEYASPLERAQAREAEDFSFAHFAGLTMAGPLEQVDLAALGTDFAVPIYFVEGQEDLTAPPALAKAYFETIRAPGKRFTTVAATGHQPSAAAIDAVWKILLEDVRPHSRE
jgi:pimeloyl-ACP methyl ester carboxylesterase